VYLRFLDDIGRASHSPVAEENPAVFESQDRRANAEKLAILKWVDQVGSEYEAAWKSLKPPQIGEFLGDASGARRAALMEELLRIDRAYRELLAENHMSQASTPPPRPVPHDTSATTPVLRAGQPPRAGPQPQPDPRTSPPRNHKQTLRGEEACGELKSADLGQALLQAEIAVPGYEILGELGRGGMGVVYKARQLKLKRLAALKVILGGVHASSEQIARFQREAGAAARLQHPNIVHIYEIGDFGGLPYFAQEFMDGGSLGKKLRTSLFSPKEAAQLVATLARAMQAAHGAGIIHRDLKPDNVLLTSCGICKIADFGLAKHLDDDSIQTQTDAVIGTPSYMAPEQASGKRRQVGPLSDIYALGAILYECLTGRPPFKAATAVETLDQVRTEEPVPPRRLQPKVPRDLETICLKCLEKQPHRRYPSALALADDLQHFLNNEPIHARRVRFWERVAKWMRRRPAAAALAGVLLALGLALPIAGSHYYAELNRNWQTERRRLQGERKAVELWVTRGRADILREDWNSAELPIEQAWQRVQTESGLADLRGPIQRDRDNVKEHLQALAIHKRFFDLHDNALFYAFLDTGEDFETNRSTARKSAIDALEVVRLSPEGEGILTMPPSLTQEKNTEITTGTYFLLLMLAEMEAREIPQERLNKALTLLERADKLGVPTRAIHLCRARYLKQQGDDRGAAEEEERAAKLAPEITRDPQDHFLVGYEHYSQGQLARAIEEFSQALLINRQHFWTHYFLGICYLLSGKPEMAVEHLTTCQGQRPELVWSYMMRGYALWRLKNYPAAEGDFKHALSLQPPRATRYVIYSNRGAMRILQRGILPLSGASAAALLGSPGRQGPLMAVSAVCAERMKHAQGMGDLNEAIELDADRYQGWEGLAVAYQLDGDLEEARKKRDKAIEVAGTQLQKHDLKPEKLAQLHRAQARLYLQLSHEETIPRDQGGLAELVGDNQPPHAEWASQRAARQAALQHLEKAAGLAKDDLSLQASVETDRGLLLHLQGRFEEARAAYEAAIAADPARADVHRWMGELLLAEAAKSEDENTAFVEQRKLSEAGLRKYKEALAAFDAYLQKGGSPSATVYEHRAMVLAKLAPPKAAIEEYGRALDAKPTDKQKGRIHLHRGQEYLTEGAYSLARSDFEDALRLDKENPHAYLGLALARVKLGDLLQAVRDAERVVNGHPKDPLLWLGAARVYVLAAAHLQSEPGQAVRPRAIGLYQYQAETLLRTAVSLVPAGQRQAFWAKYVLEDKVLYPIATRRANR
jgi:serine/threonine protein kinase/Tfp pilus assembly protein PilF